MAVLAASLRGLNRARCFGDATAVRGANDAVRWCSSEACRLAGRNPEFLLTTEDWAQAASDAAANAAANSRMLLRTRPAKTGRASR